MGKLTYDEFRTGLDFATVRQMLWVDNPDPTTWRYKTRGCVLREWRAIKRNLYDEYLNRLPPEAFEEDAITDVPEAFPPRTGLVAIRKDIRHRGRTFTVTYWTRPKGRGPANDTNPRGPEKDAATAKPGRIAVKKEIHHRNGIFTVTYWKKAV